MPAPYSAAGDPATAAASTAPVGSGLVTDAATPGGPADPTETVQLTVFDAVGGAEFFVRLVDDFYDRVAADELLMAVYPDDLSEPRRTTAGFLAQFWGGPPHYSEERGHPRLRMRHAPFAIGRPERDAWVGHMLAALDVVLPLDDPAAQPPVIAASDLAAQVRGAMVDYFERGATAMMNRP